MRPALDLSATHFVRRTLSTCVTHITIWRTTPSSFFGRLTCFHPEERDRKTRGVRGIFRHSVKWIIENPTRQRNPLNLRINQWIHHRAVNPGDPLRVFIPRIKIYLSRSFFFLFGVVFRAENCFPRGGSSTESSTIPRSCEAKRSVPRRTKWILRGDKTTFVRTTS